MRDEGPRNTIVSAKVKQNNLYIDLPGRFGVMVVVVVDVVVCLSPRPRPRPRLRAKITRNPAPREIKMIILWLRKHSEQELMMEVLSIRLPIITENENYMC